MAIRARILGAFEQAEKLPEGPERDAWMTFAIVGAGPTGVELAGSLSEIARHALRGEFRSIDPSKARIVIVEGSTRPLSMLAPTLSERAAKDLSAMGVEIICSARATNIDADGLDYAKDGIQHRLDAKVCLWAAGVKATEQGAMAAGETDAVVDRGGRVVPLADLSLAGAPMVFVAGDLACVSSGGKPVPGLAPAAKQMGLLAARNIKARLGGAPTQEFVYSDLDP